MAQRSMSTKHLWAFSRDLFLSIILVALLVLVIPFPVVKADPPPDHVVALTDSNLEAAVREAIGKPTGDIYQSDLDTLFTLDAGSRGIADLTGVEHCTSLTDLLLDDNEISDISALSGLTSLTYLNLYGNQMSDISPLAGLTSLTYLYLGSNQISDISPLGGLSNLTLLHLLENQISNLSPLSGLTSLTSLRLDGNQIGDLSPLSGLTSLTSLLLNDNQISSISALSGLTSLTYLYLYNNQISDISALSGLTGLTDLRLNDNQISSISALSGLTGLTDLRLNDNQISSISALSGLTGLTGLYLHNNQISDISALSGLTSLTDLRLNDNQISDISALSGLTSLTDLRLNDNQISSISALSGLTSLTYLYLYNNQISGISALSGLTSLTYLHLYGNQITDISPLSALANLTYLFLGNNQIGNISPLAGLSNLTVLHAIENQISNLSPLANLTSLNDLDIHNNQIADILPLVNNTGLASGDTVDLRFNTLSGISVSNYIPALEARGVEVHWDVPDSTPPNQPVNVSPADGAGAVILTPTLQSSGFSDPDAGDTHAASRWQVSTTSGDYSSSVFDSYADTANLTSIAIPSSTLDYSTTYYWHVKHKNNQGAWSPWSAQTSFTTVPTYPLVTTNAANNITATSATLNGTLTSKGTAASVTVSFAWGTADGGPYTHPVTVSPAMTDPGVFSAPLSGLAPKTTYYYIAKAVGDGGVDGAQMSFATSTIPPSVTTGAATILATTSATLNGKLTDLGTATTVNVSFAWGTADGGPYTNPVTVSPAMTDPGVFSAPLSGLAPKTTYYYIARAVGDGGVDGAQMSFATSTIPPSVTTGAATILATTSATLNGNLTDLGTATTVNVSFAWGTDTSYSGTPTTPVVRDATGTFSAPLSGLIPNTTYHFRAIAVGDGSTPGSDMTFTTSTIAPSVTTGAATILATTSATLNGNLTDLGTASSVIVSFEWGTAASYGAVTPAQSVSAIGAFSANLTGLTANTTYHFRAIAVSHGTAVYGADMTFTTGSLADTTAPTISLVTSSGITTTSATITWSTSEAATTQVKYGLTEEYDSVTPEVTTLVTGHSMDLTGLKAGKTYHYQVISKDAANNQAVWEDATFTTASPSGGMPVWAWVLIGLAAVGVAGAVAFLIRGRLAQG